MLTWGRHAGKPFADVPTSYLGWLSRRRRLDEAIRRLAQDELLRRVHEPTFQRGAYAAPRDGDVGIARKIVEFGQRRGTQPKLGAAENLCLRQNVELRLSIDAIVAT